MQSKSSKTNNFKQTDAIKTFHANNKFAVTLVKMEMMRVYIWKKLRLRFTTDQLCNNLTETSTAFDNIHICKTLLSCDKLTEKHLADRMTVHQFSK